MRAEPKKGIAMNIAADFKILLDHDFSRNNARLLRAASVSIEWDSEGSDYFFTDKSVLVVPNENDAKISVYDATCSLDYGV